MTPGSRGSKELIQLVPAKLAATFEWQCTVEAHKDVQRINKVISSSTNTDYKFC